MQDVIHRVMEAESEAKRILQDAQTEAGRLLDEARRQAKADAERTRSEVRRTADRLIREAVQAAENEKAAQLARAVQEMEAGIQMDDPLRRRCVSAAVECVTAKNQSG